MSLGDDLAVAVKGIFSQQWSVRDGQKVPESEDLRLGNDAVSLEATVLYADLTKSTDLVNRHSSRFAAEVYKTYLYCAAKIITACSGVIAAYDGDRVMGVFIGGHKNTNAAKCGLEINYAVTKIINPALKAQYPDKTYTVSQVVGIDTSPLLVARTGIRGSNDLVWVGRAANYAAKLSDQPRHSTWITGDVYDAMLDSSKMGGDPKQDMWRREWWPAGEMYAYYSTWRWPI